MSDPYNHVGRQYDRAVYARFIRGEQERMSRSMYRYFGYDPRSSTGGMVRR